MANIKKLLIAGDFHVPYHDPILFDLFLRFASDFKPDYLVINGDFLDCFAISKFDKIPHSGRMKDELKMGWKLLKKIRDALPEAEIGYIEGNHEFRLRQYLIRNAPEIYDLAPTLSELLELNQFNIDWVGTKEGASKWVDTYKRFGQLYVGHWDRVNKHSAMTAKNLVEDKGVSLIQNHVHRGGVYHKRLEDGRQLVGIENFCMCDLSPNYMGNVNWQQGWTVVYTDLEGSGRFHAYPIQVLGYKFFHQGKAYEVNPPKKLKVKRY